MCLKNDLIKSACLWPQVLSCLRAWPPSPPLLVFLSHHEQSSARRRGMARKEACLVASSLRPRTCASCLVQSQVRTSSSLGLL